MRDHRDNARDILTRGRQLIDERGWTRGNLAADPDGKPTSYDNPEARFCMVGAIDCAKLEIGKRRDLQPASDESAGLDAMGLAYELLRNALHERINLPPAMAAWNDNGAKDAAEVLAVYDRALELVDDEAAVERLLEQVRTDGRYGRWLA